MRGACPLVGVGASAGGLSAFRAFLGAVPADSRLSYIIIQHLDPSHESKLPEILRADSALPVVRAANGGTLEPGKVYVVPEGRIATVEDGVIRLRRRKDDREQLIDVLFASLAVEPATACAVLLSGFGADGVQGLREIAATGGLALVQDPATAEHPEMPMAAIEADAADFVGSPEQIAKRLDDLATHLGVGLPEPALPASEPAEEANASGAILALVEKETGVDFRHYKPSTVRRRIGRRAMLRSAESLGEYLELLRDDTDEIHSLLADMLINVTRFFRDEEVFTALKTRVFPEILERRPDGEPIRIWVPACSTGEEVYSILMALIEVLDETPDRPQITVFGTDLSETALRHARAGAYPDDICGFVEPERLERFFHHTERGYEIDKTLREMCVFARQDITRDTPFSRLDLVSMRNVLIYMDQQLQRTVLAVAHYALLPDGFLVLGTSETTESEPQLFRAFDKPRHIYLRADVPSRLPLEVTGSGRPFEAPEPGAAPAVTSDGHDLRAQAEEATLAAFAPPRILVDTNGRIVHFFGDTTPYLEHLEGRATLDAVEMATPGLTLDLRDALCEAEGTGARVEREAVYSEGGRERRVAIIVEPLAVPAGRSYRLVAFQELPPSEPGGEGYEDVARVYAAREERLRREVSSLRSRMRLIGDEKDRANEELRTANEETQSSNEELQSVNEELETAKEELQSANEELITVNEELRQRNVDLTHANDDLHNFVSSTAIPVIMLDRELRVRRFTPEAERVSHLASSDEGRQLRHIRMRVDVPDLEDVVRNVIENLEVHEREVHDEVGRWYSMQVRPYRTGRDEVEGAVLTFFDIDELRHAMDRVAKRARLSEALNAIDADIGSTMHFDEIVQRALNRGAIALGTEAGTVEMRGASHWVVRYQTGLGGEADVGLRLSDEEAPIAGRVEASRQPVMIPDVAKDPAVDVGFVKSRGVKSVLAAPMVVRDEVIGCLLFHRIGAARPFGRSEISFAARLAASVSLAVENARLLGETRRAARTADSLSRVNEILLSARTPDDVLARLVGEVSEVAGADKSLLIDVRDGVYTVTHVRNVADDLVGTHGDAAFYPAFALAASERRPIVIGDTWNDPRTNKDFVVPYALRAFQLIPLVIDGDVTAVLAFAFDTVMDFDEKDVGFSERMSTAMSLAMKNALLYERERQRAQLGVALAEIDEAVHSSLDFDEVVRQAIAEGAKALSADTGAVTMHEDAAFRVAYTCGFEQDTAGTLLPDELEPHSLIALETRRLVAIEDSATDSRVIPEHMAEQGVAAVLVVPLIVRGEAIGNLYYNYREPRTFSEAEIEFGTQLGSSISSAIENARLFEAGQVELAHTTLLREVAATAAGTLDVRDLSERVLAACREKLGAKAGNVYAIDREAGVLVATALFGFPKPLLRQLGLMELDEARASARSYLKNAVVTHDSPDLPPGVADRAKAAEATRDRWVSVPIRARGAAVGSLGLVFEEQRPFTSEEIALYQALADQLGVGLDKARLFEAEREAQHQVRRELEFAQVLLDSSAVFAEWADTLPMLDHLADVLLRSSAHSRVTVGLWDEQRGELATVVSKGEHPIPLVTTPLDRLSSPGRKLVETKKRLLIDYTKVKDAGLRKVIEERRLRFALAVPIVARDRLFGTITVDAPGEHQPFGEREIALVQSIADQAATALENARLFEAERRRANLAETLAEADAAIHSSLDVEVMMHEAIAQGARALDAPTGAITLRRGRRLVVAHSYGFPEDIAGLELSEQEERHAVLAMETRRQVLVEDTATDPRVDSEHLRAYNVAAVMVVPLVVGGAPIGCLYYNFTSPRHFRPEETEFAHQLGSTLSLAIENARLYGEVRGTSDRLTDVLDSMTDGFVSVDREWRYTLVNPQAEAIIGRPAAELLGASMEDLYPDMFGWPHYRKVMDERTPETFEVWSKPLETWLEIHAYPTADGISILFADISDRKRDEERIRRNAAIMEGIGTILQGALSAETEEALGRTCLQVVEDLTASAFGFISEIGPDGLLHDVALSDPGWEQCAMEDKSGHKRLPANFPIEGLYGKVFRDGKGFFTNAPREHAESVGVPQGHPELTAFLGVPLVSASSAIGIVIVANREGGYSETDLETVEALAPAIVEAFQRKRAEDETATAKARLDAHIDNSPLAVIEFDSEFRITRWSDEAARMFGWKAGEVLGKAIGEFRWVYDEDMTIVDAEQTNLLSAEHPRNLNVNRNYRKDGAVIWCEWYDSAIYDANGKLISIFSQVLDITERKDAEEALARTTQRLGILAESSRLLLTAEAPESVVQTISEEVMRFLDCQVFFNYVIDEGSDLMRLNAYAGVSKKEARRIAHLALGSAVCGCVGREGLRVVAEDVQHTPDERAELVRSYGMQAYACHPLVYQDKTIGTLSFGTRTRTAFTDEELELMKIVADQAATAMARKKAEDGLRASEERYRLLFANMLDGFAYCRMLFDETGKPEDFVYVEVNDAFGAITRLQDVIGRRVSEVVPGFAQTNPDVLEIYGRVASGGEPEQFETHVSQLGIWFSIGVFSPQADHFVAVFHDISEQKERARLDESLSSIRSAIGSTLDVNEIVHELATRGTEALGAEAMMILTLEGNRWVVKDSHGFPADLAGRTFAYDEAVLAREAVTDRRPVAEVTEGRGKRGAAARREGIKSVVVVPLIAQGRPLGAVSFSHLAEARPFGEQEAYFASRLTSVATAALDNALAYQRERSIADTLQEAVLAPPPSIAGIETSYLYRAASTEAAVGGDFYDVFELDGGKVAIVVGDVSGKGLEAARLTSLIRDATRAYALERDDPSWVMRKVNTLVYRSSPVESFATVFFGVLDVLSGRLRYTAAGHPPAVLHSSSAPRFLHDTPSAIVGAFESATFTSRDEKVAADDVLVLYTDGVLEARNGSEMYGDERLVAALSRLRGTSVALLPQAILDDVLAFTGGGLRDDTVIMCIRRSLSPA